MGILAIASGLLVLTTGLAAGGHYYQEQQRPPPAPEQTTYWHHCSKQQSTNTETGDKAHYASKTCPAPKAPKKEEKPPPAPPAPPPAPPAPPPTPPQVVPPSPPIPPARPPARGRLLVRKNGPARLVAGGRARFVVRVRNEGPATARGVIVSDKLPPGFFIRGLERRARATGKWKRVRPRISGTGRLVMRIGSLKPQGTTQVRITLGARRGVRGRRCNIALVNARNAPRVVAQACLRMVPPPRRKAPPRVTG
ncbi:MAG: DUF11 domain-containing protein [Thermoleophilia bacterium]|nr:DUF11 domain-containing protein [Thermoleophilia bacterium]